MFGFNWNRWNLRSRFLLLFFFFFSSVWTVNLLCRDKNHYSFTVVVLFMYCSSTVRAFKNIKNGSHGTFHTFKNYFATMFSVFSFQFSISATINSIQIDPKCSSFFLSYLLLFFVSSLFLSLVMEAVDSWVMTDSLFFSLFLSLIISLPYRVASLCVYQ